MTVGANGWRGIISRVELRQKDQRCSVRLACQHHLRLEPQVLRRDPQRQEPCRQQGEQRREVRRKDPKRQEQPVPCHQRLEHQKDQLPWGQE